MSKILLKNVRLSFVNVFSKEPAYKKKWEEMTDEEKAKAKYTCTFLLNKNDTATKSIIDNSIQEVCNKAKYKKIPKGDFICLKDGDDREYDGYKGHWSIKAGNKKRPTIINRDRSPIIEEDNIIYAGCYANAIIDFYPFNYKGEAINANLWGIQFVKDGENLEPNSIASIEEFEDLEDLDL